MCDDNERARLIGNPGAPPPPSPPPSPPPAPLSTVHVWGGCLLGWAVFTCINILLTWIFSKAGPRAAIELCPPVHVSNTTTVALNASSACTPAIDAHRLQDVIAAARFGFISSHITGITCDIAWQDPEAKFNESCTAVSLNAYPTEAAVYVKLGGVSKVARVRVDAIEWTSWGREETLTSNFAFLGVIVFAFIAIPPVCVGLRHDHTMYDGGYSPHPW